MRSAEATATSAPRLSILVVSYDGRDLLRECLGSIPDAVDGVPVEVIVVDNASPDETPDMVAREFPSVTLIRSSQNRGFAAGNNLGLEAAHGQYVMLLNPDARLLPGTLEACASYLDMHDEVSIICPRILNPDGSLQYSLMNFPAVRNALFETMLLHRILPQLTPRLGENIIESRHYETQKRVQWASGAAFMARTSAFDEIGSFDEQYFLFCEETDWFRRAAERGLAAVYHPQAVVVHRERTGRNPDLMRHAVRSRLLYARDNLPGVRAIAVRFLLVLGIGVRLVVWSLIGLAGDRRAAAQVRAYRLGLQVAIGSLRAGGLDRV